MKVIIEQYNEEGTQTEKIRGVNEKTNHTIL